MASIYREDEEIPYSCGMLDGLAFLPVDDVASGMAYLKQSAPDVLTWVVDYFEATYVSGALWTVNSNGRICFRRTPPRFQPELWNVHAVTIA